MKTRVLVIGAFTLCGLFPASAQELACDTTVECGRLSVEIAREMTSTTQQLLEKMAAYERVIASSVMLTLLDCGELGSGWKPVNIATGRFIMVTSGDQEIAAGSVGGSNSVSLSVGNLPSHSHKYQDVYFSEYRRDFPGISHIGLPDNWGTKGDDRDNVGHQMSRETVSVGSGSPVDVTPSFIAMNACQFSPTRN